MFNTLYARFEQRSRYQRTLRELRGLPMSTKLDLDIAGIESRVAHKAVYG